jgi:hypothetical protein
MNLPSSIQGVGITRMLHALFFYKPILDNFTPVLCLFLIKMGLKWRLKGF